MPPLRSPLMKAQPAVLRMHHVTKIYEGEPPFQALTDISLEIRSGEVISIIGPSGSGKSTLLHLLGCLDQPTHGDIFVGEKAISKMNEDELAMVRRDTIGFVFQAFNLAPTLSVFKNIELPLMIAGIPPEQRKPIVERNLQAVGLTEKAGNLPSQLSGGQKQRVAVARSLVNNPKILLADEPTGNLDSKSSDDVIQFILELCVARGVTVIFVTHDPRIAAHTNRQISILDGKIKSDTQINRKRRSMT
jgi:putative ABC transport system ATP-binding protein